MRRPALALIIVLAASTVFARGNLKDLTVHLQFIPQEGVHTSTAELTPEVLEQPITVTVADARKLPDLHVIGRGTGGDDKVFPIHADDEVRTFVQQTVDGIGKEWSIKQQDGAARVLTVQITTFAVDESNKALGSLYAADVQLAFTLTDARGRKLASGTGSGSTHRYGRAHSPENINEVLSDALKEAYANVLGDHALQVAWASGKAAPGASVQTQPAESVEERLRKLDDLLKKGAITKEEHQRRRAEILKEI